MFASAALLLTVLAVQFGAAGATTTDFGREDSADGVAVDDAGEVVVVGSSEAGGTSSDFALTRVDL